MKKEQIAIVKQLAAIIKPICTPVGIHPLVATAQAIAESEWMRSTLTQKHKNLFGVQASGWLSRSAYKTTTTMADNHVKDKRAFMAYPSYEDSVKDYVAFLQKNRDYKDGFKLEDPYAQLAHFAKVGYSESPAYTKLITSVMRQIGGYV